MGDAGLFPVGALLGDDAASGRVVPLGDDEARQRFGLARVLRALLRQTLGKRLQFREHCLVVKPPLGIFTDLLNRRMNIGHKAAKSNTGRK